MATKGLKYPVYAQYDDSTGSVVYSNGAVLGQALTASAKYNAGDAKLYANDTLVESDKSFTGGTLTIGVYAMTLASRALLLGHTATTGGFAGNTADAAPYVGFGFYGAKTGSKWVAFWYHKVQFGEPADELETKGEKTAYKTPTLEGELMQDVAGAWIDVEEFSTEADAIAWLNGKAGLPLSESAGLSNLAMSGTGGTLSPSFGAAVRYYTFGGVTGASVTVTATAASHTLKLYVDGVFSQNLTSGSASSAIAMSIGTKKLTITAQEAGKTTQTTEIIVVKTA